MIKIRIKKVNHWSYFNNNGHLDQGGGFVEKDTVVYVTDSLEIKQKVKNKNEELKTKAFNKFKNRN